MGRHGGEGERRGKGWWESLGHGILALLIWCLETWVAAQSAFDSFADRIKARLWRIRRPRRWLICWALAILAFVIPVVISSELNRVYERDVLIVETQNPEQGTLLSEDLAVCTMSIDLHSETIGAGTSCNTGSSYPAGTSVSVVQDPAHPERFLVVAPGQDWQELRALDIWIGAVLGTVFGLLVLLIGYRALLLVDRPEVTRPRFPTMLADGAPGRARREGPRSPVERNARWWGLKKAALVAWWITFIDTDVRVRGTLVSACVIALSLGFFLFNVSVNERLDRDRQAVNEETVVHAVLLDYGHEGANPGVRHESEVVELAYPLNDPESHELGQAIPVVADPLDPARLIPVEIADEPGFLAGARDAAPMVFGWLAAVALTGAALIPRELEAAGGAIVDSIRRQRPQTG